MWSKNAGTGSHVRNTCNVERAKPGALRTLLLLLGFVTRNSREIFSVLKPAFSGRQKMKVLHRAKRLKESLRVHQAITNQDVKAKCIYLMCSFMWDRWSCHKSESNVIFTFRLTKCFLYLFTVSVIMSHKWLLAKAEADQLSLVFPKLIFRV